MEKGVSNQLQTVPKKSKLWVWILVGIVIIIIIAGAGFYFYKINSTEEFGNVQDLNSADTRKAIEDLFGADECFDSDNGKNYSIKGHVISYQIEENHLSESFPQVSSGSFTKVFDYCTSSLDSDGAVYVDSSKYLVEEFCEGNGMSSQTIECENICENGICVPLDI
tara:strand:- start:10 stop:507 length:498 start_codon:yes stop_codon:yes gene_type:complete